MLHYSQYSTVSSTGFPACQQEAEFGSDLPDSNEQLHYKWQLNLLHCNTWPIIAFSLKLHWFTLQSHRLITSFIGLVHALVRLAEQSNSTFRGRVAFGTAILKCRLELLHSTSECLGSSLHFYCHASSMLIRVFAAGRGRGGWQSSSGWWFNCLHPCHPYRRPRLSFGLLASAWVSPGYWRHWN